MKRYTFDQVELVNAIIEEDHTTKTDFLDHLSELELNADDSNLKDLCRSLKQEMMKMTNEQFNLFVENYPICEFHHY